jgi:hypothetical protein
MAIPFVAAYADEPESMVIGRAMHATLTHKSVSVYMVSSILTPLLLELYHGADLKESLELAMIKMRPPECTGREMRDSYLVHRGPGNIPKHEKWLQHMKAAKESFIPELIEEMMAMENDEDVGGPPQVDHLNVVGRLTPSMNGNQELTTSRSLMSQARPSQWDVCSC